MPKGGGNHGAGAHQAQRRTVGDRSMNQPLVFRGVRAAARGTGLPRDFLYQAIREGRLRVVRSGRTALIPLAEIDRWLRAEAGRVP